MDSARVQFVWLTSGSFDCLTNDQPAEKVDKFWRLFLWKELDICERLDKDRTKEQVYLHHIF